MLGGDSIAVLPAGLPNIEGNFAAKSVGIGPNGAFYTLDNGGISGDSTGQGPQVIGLDAARSNPIYGASSTVQPPAISLLPQIKF